MEFRQYLERKYLDWQMNSGGRKTVQEFATYLGVGQSTVSSWWNGDRLPQGENIVKLSLKLGLETTTTGESWRCSSLQPHHAAIKDHTALEKFIVKMTDALRHVDNIPLPSPADDRTHLTEELSTIRNKKVRLLRLVEDGGLEDDPEIKERLTDLNKRIELTQARLRQSDEIHAQAQTTRTALRSLSAQIDTLPEYYRHGKKVQVNADLHLVLKKVIVGKDKELEFVWK